MGQTWQSFSLNTDGTPRGAYAIKEVCAISHDDEVTYRTWTVFEGTHPHPLERVVALHASAPADRLRDLTTCPMADFLRGEHFRYVFLDNQRHG